MTLQNRVTAFGDIVADPARGTMMGNRGGCFHDQHRQLTRRRWASKSWITCVLQFRERHRTVMSPGLYTELFFLDEATALAAGHRPCAECRHADFTQFATLWNKVRGEPGRAYVKEIDPLLHRERRTSNPAARLNIVDMSQQPDGTIVEIAGTPYLIFEKAAWQWKLTGYKYAGRLTGPARLVTPATTCEVLAAGYRPQIHPTASAARS